MKISQIIAVTAVASMALLAGSTAATATPVNGDQPSPRIVGGSTADYSSVPFTSQLLANGQFNCTSSVISATWVLTAKHCVGGGTISFRVGSGTLGQGTVVTSKRTVTWSDGDLALVELSKPYNTTYATLGATEPSVGNNGAIYGWGRETPTGPAAPKLKTANVRIAGFGSDNDGGRSIYHTGINGQAWKGDSGGPLIVGGKLVGVASTSYSQGNNPNSRSDYTSVPNAASWIKSVSGVIAK